MNRLSSELVGLPGVCAATTTVEPAGLAAVRRWLDCLGAIHADGNRIVVVVVVARRWYSRRVGCRVGGDCGGGGGGVVVAAAAAARRCSGWQRVERVSSCRSGGAMTATAIATALVAQ